MLVPYIQLLHVIFLIACGRNKENKKTQFPDREKYKQLCIILGILSFPADLYGQKNVLNLLDVPGSKKYFGLNL